MASSIGKPKKPTGRLGKRVGRPTIRRTRVRKLVPNGGCASEVASDNRISDDALKISPVVMIELYIFCAVRRPRNCDFLGSSFQSNTMCGEHTVPYRSPARPLGETDQMDFNRRAAWSLSNPVSDVA